MPWLNTKTTYLRTVVHQKVVKKHSITDKMAQLPRFDNIHQIMKKNTKNFSKVHRLFGDDILLFKVFPRIVDSFTAARLCGRRFLLGETESTEN